MAVWLPIASNVAIAYHDDQQREKIAFLGTKHDEVIRAINYASASHSTMVAGSSRQLIVRTMERAWGGERPSTTSSDNPLRVARSLQRCRKRLLAYSADGVGSTAPIFNAMLSAALKNCAKINSISSCSGSVSSSSETISSRTHC